MGWGLQQPVKSHSHRMRYPQPAQAPRQRQQEAKTAPEASARVNGLIDATYTYTCEPKSKHHKPHNYAQLYFTHAWTLGQQLLLSCTSQLQHQAQEEPPVSPRVPRVQPLAPPLRQWAPLPRCMTGNGEPDEADQAAGDAQLQA